MREIKFRAWSLDSKKWIYLGMSSMAGIVDGDLRLFYSTDDGLGHKTYPGGYQLMQYTGLKDKNGKEIYEGDIVKYRNHPAPTRHGIVEWHYGGLMVKGDSTWTGFRLLNSVEVIGNIYENPELLTPNTKKEL